MNIVFRTDASQYIGSGHVMRCLTLADELYQQGNEITFICRSLKGNLVDYIIRRGYSVKELKRPNQSNVKSPEDWLEVNWVTDVEETIKAISEMKAIDLLIIDHYSIDYKWEEKIKSKVKQILVIDDLANRTHDCDVLLDQNVFDNQNTRYEGLIPRECKTLLGSKYALIRNEFINFRAVENRNKIVNTFVYFGAVDTTNETVKVLKVLKNILESERYNYIVKVVVGHANPNKEVIQNMCSQDRRFIYYSDVKNMAELMSESDFAIGAGGSTTWERCCVGLPSIVVPVAENQIAPMKELEKLGAIQLIQNPTSNDYHINTLNFLQKNKTNLMKMVESGKSLYDGYGAKRVAEYLMRKDGNYGYKGTL